MGGAVGVAHIDSVGGPSASDRRGRRGLGGRGRLNESEMGRMGV